MTVFETPALRATSATARSGPTCRTASTAAATRSSRRARRCSVHRDRRPSGGGGTKAPLPGAPTGEAACCMCPKEAVTVLHTIARRLHSPEELPDDRHTARFGGPADSPAGRPGRNPRAVAAVGREEVLRPGGRHRLVGAGAA